MAKEEGATESSQKIVSVRVFLYELNAKGVGITTKPI